MYKDYPLPARMILSHWLYSSFVLYEKYGQE